MCFRVKVQMGTRDVLQFCPQASGNQGENLGHVWHPASFLRVSLIHSHGHGCLILGVSTVAS